MTYTEANPVLMKLYLERCQAEVGPFGKQCLFVVHVVTVEITECFNPNVNSDETVWKSTIHWGFSKFFLKESHGMPFVVIPLLEDL